MLPLNLFAAESPQGPEQIFYGERVVLDGRFEEAFQSSKNFLRNARTASC